MDLELWVGGLRAVVVGDWIRMRYLATGRRLYCAHMEPSITSKTLAARKKSDSGASRYTIRTIQ
jgi:hypothetical protein